MISLKNRVTAVALAGLFLSPASYAALTSYSQDFEDLDAENEFALGDVGWVVGANVFAADGTTFLYNYFVFPAPNGSGAFSNVGVGEGGPDQGEQQMVVFNDYNNADHGNGTGNIIEANVFQEQTIMADDVGDTYTFVFDAKAGDLAAPTTAIAFIKTLNPAAGFFVTNFLTQDTTALPAEWMRYELSLTISADLVGQLIQFGFANNASNFTPSGVVYDNVYFGLPDADIDGVLDSVDNCTNVANPDQYDSNGDGIGSRCDADVTGFNGGPEDCFVNFADLDAMRVGFFTPAAVSPDLDFDNSGFVNFADLDIMSAQFFGQPGPSATGCN